MKFFIKHDYSCISLFMDAFKDIYNTSESSIAELLSSQSYQNLIKDIGENFSLGETSDWIKIFNLAYKSFKNNEDLASESLFIDLATLSIIDSLNNIENLLDYTKEVIDILDKKEFIEKSKYYLPNLNKDVTITIVYSIFMRNAVVENNKIYIDIPFTRLLSKTQLNDLLSHELHHYLKEFCEPKIKYTNCSNRVIKFLKVLESEGIANLCNLESIYPVYKLLELNLDTSFEDELKNVDEYMISFLKLLEMNIMSKNFDISFNDEFIESLKYITMSYHMAKTILDSSGIDVIRSLVGQPVQFFIKYLECSRLNESNIYLSKETINILYKL